MVSIRTEQPADVEGIHAVHARSFPSAAEACVEYLHEQPPAHRPIYKAVLRALSRLGEIDVDPVRVGIMIKRARTFCELRPKRSDVELSFKLSRPLASPRIFRTVRCSTHREAHFIHLQSPGDVDAEVLSWITESYLESSD